MAVIKLLKQKGILATIVGIITTVPVNAYYALVVFDGGALSSPQERTVLIINIIGWIWVILPSKVSIKSKLGEIVIED